ncbi:C40 family peptidase [Streptosporangium soli]|nr:NlpC/P60 family protein [Streptosporangium sp. KLBMP 9127]
MITTNIAAADPRPSADQVAEARQTVRDRSQRLGAATADLATARTRLQDLRSNVERLVEAYNGEMVRLRDAEAAYQGATERLRVADGRVAETRATVAMLAAQSYGGVDLTRPMIGMVADDGGGSAGFLHQASVLEYMSGAQAELLKRVREAQQVSAILRGQAQDAFEERRVAAERVKAARAAAHAAVSRQRGATRALRGEKKSIAKRLTAARTRAQRLAYRRAAAVDRSIPQGVPGWMAGGSTAGDIAVTWALGQLGKPYVWAAAGPDTYDCSGLTMRAWEQVGVRLDHWTGTQWTSGPHIPTDALARGDLVFFGQITDNPGDIHHVGIYVGKGMMVHAPQTGDVVRIASIWRSDLVGATRPG